MNLPEQDLFSVKDVAARWQKSVSYVQDLTRRGLLPMNRGDVTIIHGPGRKRIKLTAFVTRQDLEQFERSSTPVPRYGSLKEAAAYYDRDRKTINLWRKDGKVHGKKSPGGRWLIELRPL